MDPRQLAEQHNNLIAAYLDYSSRPGYENYLGNISNDIENIRRSLSQIADFRLDQMGYINELIPITPPQQQGYNQSYFNRGGGGYPPKQPMYNKPVNYYNRAETNPYNNNNDRYGKLANKVDMSPKQPIYGREEKPVIENKEKIFIAGHNFPLLTTNNKRCKEDEIGNGVYQYIIENGEGSDDSIKGININTTDHKDLDSVYKDSETTQNINVVLNGYVNNKCFIDDDELERIADVDDINMLDLSLLKLNKDLASYNFYKSYFTRLFNFLCKVKLVKRTLSSDDILSDIYDIDNDLIKANKFPDSTAIFSKIKNIIVKSISMTSILSDKENSFTTLPIVFIPNKYNKVLEDRMLKSKYKSETFKITELSSEDFYNMLKSEHVDKLLNEYGFICLTYKNIDGLYRYRLVTKSEIDNGYYLTRNSYYI
jgi:hypothetical protein